MSLEGTAPPPAKSRVKDAPPTRAIDAALGTLQHLGEQERMIVSHHARRGPHRVRSSPRRHRRTRTCRRRRSRLRVRRSQRPSPCARPGRSRASAANPACRPSPWRTRRRRPRRPTGAAPLLSYQKVRRWDMLPKHAWLQAAESGQAPGPGFRDVSATQTMRSYGSKGPAAGASRSGGASGGRASPDGGGGEQGDAEHDDRFQLLARRRRPHPPPPSSSASPRVRTTTTPSRCPS